MDTVQKDNDLTAQFLKDLGYDIDEVVASMAKYNADHPV